MGAPPSDSRPQGPDSVAAWPLSCCCCHRRSSCCLSRCSNGTKTTLRRFTLQTLLDPLQGLTHPAARLAAFLSSHLLQLSAPTPQLAAIARPDSDHRLNWAPPPEVELARLKSPSRTEFNRPLNADESHQNNNNNNNNSNDDDDNN